MPAKMRAGDRVEQAAEREGGGADIPGQAKRRIELRLGDPDPRRRRGQRRARRAHVGALAQACRRECRSRPRPARRGIGWPRTIPAVSAPGRPAGEHGEPIGGAGEGAFEAGDGGRGLRAGGAGLLGIERGDQAGLDPPAGDLEIVVGDGERVAGQRQPRPGRAAPGRNWWRPRRRWRRAAPRGRNSRLRRRRRPPRCRARMRPNRSTSQAASAPTLRLVPVVAAGRRCGRRSPDAPTVGTSPARAWTSDFARLDQPRRRDGEVEIAGARFLDQPGEQGIVELFPPARELGRRRLRPGADRNKHREPTSAPGSGAR